MSYSLPHRSEIPESARLKFMSDLSRVYLANKSSIVKVIIKYPDGHGNREFDVGTAFHIGDGLIVTARHVLRIRSKDGELDNKIESISREIDDEPISVQTIHYHSDSQVDLAVLETD